MKLSVTGNNITVYQNNDEITVNGVTYPCKGVKSVEVTDHGIYFDGFLVDDKKYLRRNKIPYVVAILIIMLIPICYLLINI